MSNIDEMGEEVLMDVIPMTIYQLVKALQDPKFSREFESFQRRVSGVWHAAEVHRNEESKDVLLWYFDSKASRWLSSSSAQFQGNDEVSLLWFGPEEVGRELIEGFTEKARNMNEDDQAFLALLQSWQKEVQDTVAKVQFIVQDRTPLQKHEAFALLASIVATGAQQLQELHDRYKENDDDIWEEMINRRMDDAELHFAYYLGRHIPVLRT